MTTSNDEGKKNVYSTMKIFSHKDVIEKMNDGKVVSPLLIQLMWQNLCNHDCEFCSYRRSGNKNNEMFNDRQFISREKMLELLSDFKDIGVKAIEITGGGEPTIYPYFEEGVTKMVENGFDIGIVSNGSNFKEEWMKIMSPNLLWARISIDSGRVEDYMRVRNVTEKHWERAWKSVYNLRKNGSHPEFTLGVGYVVTWDNYLGIKEGIRLAKENGAHNVRVSAAFTEKFLNYYGLGKVGNNTSDVIKKASDAANEAIALYQDDNFKVFNLFDERIQNMVEGKQDYDFCMSKEVVCVVGGDSKVYTCCSLAFNPRGLVGDIMDQSFKKMWFSEENEMFLRAHDPRSICNVMCLYETRNKQFLKDRDRNPDEVLGGVVPKHKNFI